MAVIKAGDIYSELYTFTFSDVSDEECEIEILDSDVQQYGETIVNSSFTVYE
jgi:hypothetical protein